MSTEERAEKAEPSGDSTGATETSEELRPLNRAERRAQGKKGATAHPFAGGGTTLPLGQRIHGGGPAGGKSRFNRKVGGK
jgi:hypothetical protein